MRKVEIDDLLTAMLESHDNVSDLNVTVDRPLQVESSGELVGVPVDPAIDSLTPFQTEIFALNLINNDRRLCRVPASSRARATAPTSLPGKARFRVNIFSQRGNISIVLRKLETKIPTIEELQAARRPSRRCRPRRTASSSITGATGSGKTTSLAALLNEINATKSVHIVTLEDPVEYVHPNRKATFNQRELGLDYDSFASGLRAALRQAPKIILVGEMRDRETAELALKASETGHLVLSTLHTVNAGQAINRIVGMFDQDEEKQIRQRLAGHGPLDRGPAPGAEGRRRPLGRARHPRPTPSAPTSSSSTARTEGKTFYDIQEVGEPFGMMTFDQSLLRVVRERHHHRGHGRRLRDAQGGRAARHRHRSSRSAARRPPRSRASGSTPTTTARVRGQGRNEPMATSAEEFAARGWRSSARTRPSGRR